MVAVHGIRSADSGRSRWADRAPGTTGHPNIHPVLCLAPRDISHDHRSACLQPIDADQLVSGVLSDDRPDRPDFRRAVLSRLPVTANGAFRELGIGDTQRPVRAVPRVVALAGDRTGAQRFTVGRGGTLEAQYLPRHGGAYSGK